MGCLRGLWAVLFQNPEALKGNEFLQFFSPTFLFSFHHSKSHRSLFRDSKWVLPSAALRARKTPHPLFSPSTFSSRKVLKATLPDLPTALSANTLTLQFPLKANLPSFVGTDGWISWLPCCAVHRCFFFCLWIRSTCISKRTERRNNSRHYDAAVTLSTFYSLLVSVYLLCSLPLFLPPFMISWLLMTSGCWPSVPPIRISHQSLSTKNHMLGTSHLTCLKLNLLKFLPNSAPFTLDLDHVIFSGVPEENSEIFLYFTFISQPLRINKYCAISRSHVYNKSICPRGEILWHEEGLIKNT